MFSYLFIMWSLRLAMYVFRIILSFLLYAAWHLFCLLVKVLFKAFVYWIKLPKKCWEIYQEDKLPCPPLPKQASAARFR